MSRPRLLYYFTDRPGLAALRAAGQLIPQQLTVGHRPVKLRRPVLLLSEQQAVTPTARMVARVPVGARVEVRLTVAAAGAQRWLAWADRHRVPSKVLARVDEECEGHSECLWLVQEPILAADWLTAEDTETGQLLWRAVAPPSPRVRH